MFALEALRDLAPAVLRHLVAYGELAGDEAAEALQQWLRRATGLVAGAVTGFVAVVLGCIWAIAAAWDGPRRLTVIGALCIGFAVLSALGLLYARFGGRRRLFPRLRVEWQQDREMLSALDPQLFGRPVQPEPWRAGGE